MALITQADVEQFTGIAIDSGRAAGIAQAILAAQTWVAHQAGLRSIEKETAAVTVYLDTKNADETGYLWLPSDVRPAHHAGADLIAVVESGSALTGGSAFGYSATADVTIRGANGISAVALFRPQWGEFGAYGRNNVAVTCKVGFDIVGATNLAVPQDVRTLLMEVAWNLFTMPATMGRTSTSKAGASASFDGELSPLGKATLAWLCGGL